MNSWLHLWRELYPQRAEKGAGVAGGLAEARVAAGSAEAMDRLQVETEAAGGRRGTKNKSG